MIEVSLLRKLLRYEPETGKLYWLERTPDMFRNGYRSAEGNCANWNGKNAGREAMTADDGNGYRQGAIFGRNIRAHTIAWALHYGEWPKGEIDHISGDRSDNRISNLRAVSHRDNSRNTKLRSDNTSGVMGVYWIAKSQKWEVRVGMRGSSIFLGRYDCIHEAAKARQAANEQYGFHQNHGRKANG